MKKSSNIGPISPLDYRYIRIDEELKIKVKKYDHLNILSKIKKIIPELVIPRLDSLEKILFDIAKENKYKQIPKRVDGKHQGKITLKKVFENYAKRLVIREEDIKMVASNFKHLITPYKYLGGIQQNDMLSDLIYFSVSTLSVEANIANDIRHQFRSEIEEYKFKDWPEDRVGSSTMPHKINPAEYEKIVSLWKTYLPRVNSAILGQVIEHQGDSTNEHVPYDAFEVLCCLSYTTKSLENALKNLKINI